MSDLHIKLGTVAASASNTVGALKEFKQAVLIDPMNPKPYLAMAELREQRGDFELAIDELKSGLELMPADPSLQKRIGADYMKMGRVDDAIAHFETAMKSQPDADVVQRLSQALYLKSRSETQDAFVASSDYQTAEATLQKAIKLAPNDLKLRLALAKLHSVAGQPVNLAKVGTPHSVPEKIAFAEALLAQNQFDKSFDQMQEVIRQTKSAKDAIAIAEIAMLNMDHQSAAAAFAKAGELGEQERANFGIAAIDRLKHTANERLTLANDLAKRGQLQSAADNYRDAIAADPRLADAHLGLSRVSERLSGKSAAGLDDAAKELRAFVDLNKNMPDAQRQKDLKRIEALQMRAAKIRLRESASAKQTS
jgi:tetratricopeptide (TPR) repeat protein